MDIDAYIAKNPAVWEQFKDYAFEARASGRRYFSARTIVERIRWNTLVSERDSTFKVSDHVSSYLGRKLMKEYPEYDGFFRTKVQKNDLPAMR